MHVVPLGMQHSPPEQLSLQQSLFSMQSVNRLLQHVVPELPEHELPVQQSAGLVHALPTLEQHTVPMHESLQQSPFLEQATPPWLQQDSLMQDWPAAQLFVQVTGDPQLSVAVPEHWAAQALPLS
jgi:hypothetical protein